MRTEEEIYLAMHRLRTIKLDKNTPFFVWDWSRSALQALEWAIGRTDDVVPKDLTGDWK